MIEAYKTDSDSVVFSFNKYYHDDLMFNCSFFPCPGLLLATVVVTPLPHLRLTGPRTWYHQLHNNLHSVPTVRHLTSKMKPCSLVKLTLQIDTLVTDKTYVRLRLMPTLKSSKKPAGTSVPGSAQLLCSYSSVSFSLH